MMKQSILFGKTSDDAPLADGLVDISLDDCHSGTAAISFPFRSLRESSPYDRSPLGKNPAPHGRGPGEDSGLEQMDRHRAMSWFPTTGATLISSLAGNIPIQFRWTAKAELFRLPFMGWAMSRIGYIPIERDSPKKPTAVCSRRQRR